MRPDLVSISRIETACVLLASGLSVCFGVLVSGSSHAPEFVLIAVIIVVMALPLALRIRKRSFQLFEPLTWFVAAMLLFVVLRVIAVIRVESYIWRGLPTEDGVTKMLLVSLVGIAAWMVGYESAIAKHLAARFPPLAKKLVPTTSNIYILCLTSAMLLGLLLFMYQANLSANWLLAGRSTYDEAFRGSIGYFYGAKLLVVPVILLCMGAWFERNRIMLIALSPPIILVLVPEIVKGNRLFLLQVTLSAAAFYYLVKKRRPGWFKLLLMLALAFVVFSVLREVRTESTNTSFDEAITATVSNPTMAWESIVLGPDAEAGQGLMYLVQIVPEELDFQPGSVASSVLALPIPRTVWPEKPTFPEEQIMEFVFPEDYARSRAGATFTAMGSFYYDSGTIGVVIGMFLTGAIFRSVWEYLLRSSGYPSLMIASTLPTLVVTFARASIPPIAINAFWTVLPIILAAALLGRRKRPAFESEGIYARSANH